MHRPTRIRLVNFWQAMEKDVGGQSQEDTHRCENRESHITLEIYR
jgi:hypothetical protein